MNSNYDGIEEENNPMPGWWVWLFIFTVIYGFIYWLHYEMGGGRTQAQEYAEALQNYHSETAKNSLNAPAESEEMLSVYMKNESVLLNGAQVFSEKCAMCHGVSLEGKIGPNLTDHFWVLGAGTRTDIVKIIKEGSPAKGMPAWQPLLKPDEIKNVAAYVFSKIGSKPANPKGPDGAEIKK